MWTTRILWTCGQQGCFGHVANKDALDMQPTMIMLLKGNNVKALSHKINFL